MRVGNRAREVAVRVRHTHDERAVLCGTAYDRSCAIKRVNVHMRIRKAHPGINRGPTIPQIKGRACAQGQ